MEKLLSRCAWPGLPENYDQALREAVQFILKRFDVLGIVAAGTIIRGSPDATSDLDIYVIHPAPFRQRVQKFFNGIPTEIFVNPPAMVEKYFIEERAFFVEPALARRLKVAEQLADLVLGARGFFEWESAPDKLEGEK